jgi:hypothetical protein
MTPETNEGGSTETDRAILVAARTEMHADLAELSKALLAVIHWSNTLKQSLVVAQRVSNTLPGSISYLGPDGLKHGMSIPKRVLSGEWGAQWKLDYGQWVLSIRAAMDAVGRSSLAAIMDRNSHPNPALCWTALVRDALNRLQAQLHPMKEGADGMGFLRAGANSLPPAFGYPLDRIRRAADDLAAVALTFTPVAKEAGSTKTVPPEQSVESESESEASLITLSANERKLLNCMERRDGSYLWTASALGDIAGLSDEIARRFIARLCDHNLAERPDGIRRGARLTGRGREKAKAFSKPHG